MSKKMGRCENSKGYNKGNYGRCSGKAKYIVSGPEGSFFQNAEFKVCENCKNLLVEDGWRVIQEI